jgi:coiled-coil domain-containing protein 12
MTDRKARLAALAAKAGRNNNGEENRTEVVAELKFRNYTPVLLLGTAATSSSSPEAPPPHNGRTAPPSKKMKTRQNDGKDDEPSILEKALERALEKARKDAAAASLIDDPEQRSNKPTEMKKKINWDLKRDIQPKLDRLEKRTQKAIVSLLKQRLENEAAASSTVLD